MLTHRINVIFLFELTTGKLGTQARVLGSWSGFYMLVLLLVAS